MNKILKKYIYPKFQLIFENNTQVYKFTTFFIYFQNSLYKYFLYIKFVIHLKPNYYNNKIVG